MHLLGLVECLLLGNLVGDLEDNLVEDQVENLVEDQVDSLAGSLLNDQVVNLLRNPLVILLANRLLDQVFILHVSQPVQLVNPQLILVINLRASQVEDHQDSLL